MLYNIIVYMLQSLLDVGVVAGYDMTSEAALAKLSYVLTKPWTLQEKKEVRTRAKHIRS